MSFDSAHHGRPFGSLSSVHLGTGLFVGQLAEMVLLSLLLLLQKGPVIHIVLHRKVRHTRWHQPSLTAATHLLHTLLSPVVQICSWLNSLGIQVSHVSLLRRLSSSHLHGILLRSDHFYRKSFIACCLRMRIQYWWVCRRPNWTAGLNLLCSYSARLELIGTTLYSGAWAGPQLAIQIFTLQCHELFLVGELHGSLGFDHHIGNWNFRNIVE